MIRSARAAGRLLRCLLHILHGLGLIWLRFESIDAPARLVFIQWWASKTLVLLGIEMRVQGAPAAGRTLLVANHVSWLDIMAVHAVCPRARFVSKAAVRSYARTWTHELAARGIRVNTLSPGPIDTPIFDNVTDELRAAFAARIPFKRFGRPEEVAAAALFLASDESSFVAGAELVIDGGMTA